MSHDFSKNFTSTLDRFLKFRAKENLARIDSTPICFSFIVGVGDLSENTAGIQFPLPKTIPTLSRWTAL